MKNRKLTAILTILFLSLSLTACTSDKVDVLQESSSEKETSEKKEEETETTKESESTEEEKEIETETTKETESQKETEIEESKEEESKEEISKETKSAETKPIETTTPKEEHKHNFTSTDSPSSCTVAGIRTYTCTSCGYSYTENLGYGAHDFSIPVYQTVHHDEVYQTVPRTVKVTIMHCACGYTSTNEEEYQAHCVASIQAGNLVCGSSDWYEDTTETVYDYVKVSDAYDEQVIVGYQCSVCGQTQ